jgi:hypothetical protein
MRRDGVTPRGAYDPKLLLRHPCKMAKTGIEQGFGFTTMPLHQVDIIPLSASDTTKTLLGHPCRKF